MHRVSAADSYPSAGINRIRFIELKPCSFSQPARLSDRLGHPVE